MSDLSSLTPGAPVECRTASGDWTPMIAMGPARYDKVSRIRYSNYLTVPVCLVAAWDERGVEASWVNWPAEDVRIPEATS